MPDKLEGSDDQVDDRATGITKGSEDDGKVAEGDPERARRAAAAILEESEERTFDNATVDLDDESVPRRSSEETA